eukprot:9916572-Heterocapsa_arctica.AAC.1
MRAGCQCCAVGSLGRRRAGVTRPTFSSQVSGLRGFAVAASSMMSWEAGGTALGGGRGRGTLGSGEPAASEGGGAAVVAAT